MNEIEAMKVQQEKGFAELDINVNAKNDFRFLCSKTNYLVLNNINLLTVKTAKDVQIGDFLVVGHNMENKMVTFPQNLLPIKEKTFVAVVCYGGGSVKDVLVFKAESFKKTGAFGIFKKPNASEFGIKVGSLNDAKLKQYSFGYVLNNL